MTERHLGKYQILEAAVSYTHLDVYKRQMYDCLPTQFWIARSSRLTSGSSRCSASSQAPQRMTNSEPSWKSVWPRPISK